LSPEEKRPPGTPKPEEAIAFQVDLSVAFPPDSKLACWIAALSIASNDLRTVFEGLYATQKDDPSSKTESQYYARLLCSHAYEAAMLVMRGLRKPEIASFVKSLPIEAHVFLKEVKQACSPPGKSFIEGEVARVRHASFHYKLSEVAAALLHVRQYEPDQVGLVTIGDSFLALRLHYAAELSARIAVGEPEEMELLGERIVNLVAALLGFTHQAIPYYLFQVAPPHSIKPMADSVGERNLSGPEKPRSDPSSPTEVAP